MKNYFTIQAIKNGFTMLKAALYFGAEFTRAYADFYGIEIQPALFAVHIEQTEDVRNVKKVPPKHKIGKSNGNSKK
jgi:hypothetical protein